MCPAWQAKVGVGMMGGNMGEAQGSVPSPESPNGGPGLGTEPCASPITHPEEGSDGRKMPSTYLALALWNILPNLAPAHMTEAGILCLPTGPHPSSHSPSG